MTRVTVTEMGLRRTNGGHTESCAIFAGVVLTQTFRVVGQDGTPEGAALAYDAHEGGEGGAEIGSYPASRADGAAPCRKQPTRVAALTSR